MIGEVGCEANSRVGEQAVDQSNHLSLEGVRQEANCVENSRKDLRTNGEVSREGSMEKASDEAPNHRGSDDEADDRKQENYSKRKETTDGEQLKQSKKKQVVSRSRSPDGQADRRAAAADEGEQPDRHEPHTSERIEGGTEADTRQEDDSAEQRSVGEAKRQSNGQEGASEDGAAPRAPPDDRGGKQDGEDESPEKKEEADGREEGQGEGRGGKKEESREGNGRQEGEGGVGEEEQTVPSGVGGGETQQQPGAKADYNYLQRVKVYRLNDDGKWDDKGTGHVSVEYLEVRTENANQPQLFCSFGIGRCTAVDWLVVGAGSRSVRCLSSQAHVAHSCGIPGGVQSNAALIWGLQ